MQEAPNYFEKTIGYKLNQEAPEGEKSLLSDSSPGLEHLKPFQYARLKGFVEFQRLPEEGSLVDHIVMLGTSKVGDPVSYKLRLDEVVKLHGQYPGARIIVSGARSAPSRALPGEMDSDYNEALIIAKDLKEKGIQIESGDLELTATNSRENIFNSLELILAAGEMPQGVVFVGSSYMGRRIDLYIKKFLNKKNIQQDALPTFIVDGDVAQHQGDPLKEETTRQRAAVKYEWRRLAEYRRRGDL